MNDNPQAIPGRYSLEAALTEEFHWTYDQIQDQPNDFIDELLVRRASRGYWHDMKREMST
jgi:hypothetical protein